MALIAFFGNSEHQVKFGGYILIVNLIFSFGFVFIEIICVGTTFILSVRTYYKWIYFFIDIMIVIFFIISGYIISWGMEAWFTIIQWYPFYIFLRFVIVLFIYRIRRNEKTLLNPAILDALPQRKKNVRQVIVTANGVINVIAMMHILSLQFSIYNA